MAVVEYSGNRSKSREWAMEFRRNILEHELTPNCPYFLIVLPDRIFIWKDAGVEPELVEPDFEVDATPFFSRYFDLRDIKPGQMHRGIFELYVRSWLQELVYFGLRPEIPDEQRRVLIESGLMDAFKNGDISRMSLV
ncbi:MAG: hypothetical protein WEB58_11980 [Planctomycetaceae bacterium]